MEMSTNENSLHSTISSNDGDHQHDNLVPSLLNHGEDESKNEIAEEEARGILELIASTGKFWHDWDKLKSLLSFQLKQVLSEYPEAKMTSDQQNSALGETFQELVKRLDEVLCSFIEGPPFTLQRICEILLTAQSIYPNLSKLALALEKNLLVTSTLTISTDSYPPKMIQKPDEPDKGSEEPQLHRESVPNGVEPMVGDRDEIMAEVEEADIDDDMTIDMEAFEEIVGSSETNSLPTSNS
ncbi:hypothetical protein L1049_003181 [Liquidambar formosana]|uniref:Serine/threonine-protein phosphatase 4 regulatory subunit 2 n=1 Tax=Liquidambar formosana TaxID=63359 RepID=A0AAP0R9D3_LIQFO